MPLGFVGPVSKGCGAYQLLGVCELRGRSGAAPLRTGSSPAAVGSPGSCDHRDAAPSRRCSAAGSSPLLRRRSSCSHCRFRYRRCCFRRCCSCRNDRSQTETSNASSGGPWLERRRAVVDESNEGNPFRNLLLGPQLSPPSYLGWRPSTASVFWCIKADWFVLRWYLEPVDGSGAHMSHKHHLYLTPETKTHIPDYYPNICLLTFTILKENSL